jgi:octanoyl-[GcvH]:protein N-octanoyltransferase
VVDRETVPGRAESRPTPASGIGRRSIALLDESGPGHPAGGRDPLLDSALGPALLQTVAAAGGPETLRMYRPRPTLAFSGRDCAAAGIGDAAGAAAAAGFTPVRRGPGGRAAAYHAGALCLDHVGIDVSGQLAGAPGAFGPQQIRPRFIEFGHLLTDALRAVGVDARLGPVPGEYCPGEFSINDGRGHKLVGTAQRLVRGGWLFGTVILVTDPEPVREVLIPVYRALGLDWDPQTVGAVQSTAPGVTVTEVRAAVLHAMGRLGVFEPVPIDAGLLEVAAGRADRHRVPAT